MKTVLKKLTYAIGATILAAGVSGTAVNAEEVITISPTNIGCADVEAILPDTWPQDMKTFFQVEAANEYGVAVSGQGGNFDMMCGGQEIFANNNMENLTASGNGADDIDITPEHIEVEVVGDATDQENIDLSLNGEEVIIYFTADDATDADTRARRRYRARLRFRGRVRRR